MMVGQIVSKDYPRKNLIDLQEECTRRRVQILELIDISKRGIYLDAFLESPFTRRTRILSRVFDFTRLSERRFYDPEADPVLLQLGVFDPESGECLRRIGGTYEQTREGLEELVATCENIVKDESLANIRTSLAIFAAA
jgi:hypothetical protein